MRRRSAVRSAVLPALLMVIPGHLVDHKCRLGEWESHTRAVNAYPVNTKKILKIHAILAVTLSSRSILALFRLMTPFLCMRAPLFLQAHFLALQKALWSLQCSFWWAAEQYRTILQLLHHSRLFRGLLSSRHFTHTASAFISSSNLFRSMMMTSYRSIRETVQ